MLRRSLLITVLTLACAVPALAGPLLLDRGPDMVYDTVLDITWTRQAGDGVFRDFEDAYVWANALTVGGFDDWRLPWASVSAGTSPPAAVYSCNGSGGADEVACQDNEMGYMYYYNLGGVGDNKGGYQTAVGGEELTGIQPVSFYWSGTPFDNELDDLWYFAFYNGIQGVENEDDADGFAWAVRSGDVGEPVPEPASLLLFGIGVLGLVVVRLDRRRQHL